MSCSLSRRREPSHLVYTNNVFLPAVLVTCLPLSLKRVSLSMVDEFRPQTYLGVAVGAGPCFVDPLVSKGARVGGAAVVVVAAAAVVAGSGRYGYARMYKVVETFCGVCYFLCNQPECNI